MSKKPKNKPGLHFYKDEKGEWRWKIVASNGRIIGASTEGYKRLRSAEQNLEDIRYGKYTRVAG